jgi:hypothetical protein
MNTHPVCPACRAAIPPDAPGGICPSCALLGAAGPTVVMPSTTTASREEVAAAFPDLEILDMIGQGGMGVVFKVRQPRLDRFVALKILPPHLAAQPGFSERFTREARALARLHHPHIVTVFDFGESGGFFYLLMEYVDGVNLRKAMQAGIKPEQAMLLVPRICEALQFAHEHGVLHRDIKPENILLDTKGTPKLADFGIAKLAGEAFTGLTLSGAALGTAAYMAPEQIEKPATVDHRADIYSLGVVFYEMLTGELPLGRFAAPSEIAAVGGGVDAVVLRALEKERSRRQQSAGEMKTQVEGVNINMPAAAPPLPASPPDGGPPESAMKHLLGVLTALCGVGIPASAVIPAFHKIGLTPPAMVFLCAAFGVLAAAWPGKHSRRGRPPGPWVATPGPRFESRSRRWLFGMPLFHIVRGINPATGVAPVARGIVAIGPVARGWFALGGRAHGVIALGGMATGIVTAGGISVGIISAGGLAVGLLCAVGGLSVGSLVLGGTMVGLAPLVTGSSGRPLGGRMILGPLAEVSGDFVTALQRGLAIGAIVIGVCTFVVLMCALFSATPAPQPAAGQAPPAPPVNPWPRRIFWLIAIVVLGPALLFFVSLPLLWMARADGKSDAQYEKLPVRDAVNSSRAPFAAVWDKGSAELVAVSHYPSLQGPWWGMDGRAATQGSFVWEINPRPGAAGGRAREFVFQLRDLPPGASAPRWRIRNGSVVATSTSVALSRDPAASLPGYVAFAADLPEETSSTSIKCGIASADWQTIASFPPDKLAAGTVTHDGVAWKLMQGAVTTGEAGATASLTGTWQVAWQSRLVAVGATGEEKAPTGETSSGERMEWHFSDVKTSDLKQWRFQVRPYEWIEFRDVALTPRQNP